MRNYDILTQIILSQPKKCEYLLIAIIHKILKLFPFQTVLTLSSLLNNKNYKINNKTNI